MLREDPAVIASSLPVAVGDLRDDLAGLLGKLDELQWADGARRVIPAQQRLGSHDATGGKPDDRLVVQAELAAVQRFAELAVEL